LVSQVESGSDDALEFVGETNRWERVLKCVLVGNFGRNVEFGPEMATSEQSVLVYKLLDLERKSDEIERLVTGSSLADSGGAGERHVGDKSCGTGLCKDVLG